MEKQKKDNHSIGSLLRDRGKTPVEDIGEVWHTQKKYANKTKRNELAKRKKKKEKLQKKVKKTKQTIKKKINFKKIKTPNFAKRIGIKRAIPLVVIVIILLMFVGKNTTETPKDQLGVSVSKTVKQEENKQAPALDKTENTDFELLFPTGKVASDYDIAKVSPPENDPVYAYVDVFNNAELRVSQQAIPESFKGNVATKIQEIATSFQATDVIQINDTKIYHGLSDKQGGVQSLIFEKNNLIVFIASPVKFSDDVWTGYILNLN